MIHLERLKAGLFVIGLGTLIFGSVFGIGYAILSLGEAGPWIMLGLMWLFLVYVTGCMVCDSKPEKTKRKK